MEKTKAMKNEARSRKAINMINQHDATWEDVAEALKISVGYIQKIVKKHYKTEKAYKRLLEKARNNKKAKDIVATAGKIEDVEDIKETVVVETGYLLNKGIEGLTRESLEVYIPQFCIRELEKLSKYYKVAEEVLTFFYATHGIKILNLRGREELFEEPTNIVKNRTKGVTAVCCYLWSMGSKVRLMTNSKEIEGLANRQKIGIDVVRVK